MHDFLSKREGTDEYSFPHQILSSRVTVVVFEVGWTELELILQSGLERPCHCGYLCALLCQLAEPHYVTSSVPLLSVFRSLCIYLEKINFVDKLTVVSKPVIKYN